MSIGSDCTLLPLLIKQIRSDGGYLMHILHTIGTKLGNHAAHTLYTIGTKLWQYAKVCACLLSDNCDAFFNAGAMGDDADVDEVEGEGASTGAQDQLWGNSSMLSSPWGSVMHLPLPANTCALPDPMLSSCFAW